MRFSQITLGEDNETTKENSFNLYIGTEVAAYPIETDQIEIRMYPKAYTNKFKPEILRDLNSYQENMISSH